MCSKFLHQNTSIDSSNFICKLPQMYLPSTNGILGHLDRRGVKSTDFVNGMSSESCVESSEPPNGILI